MNPPFGSFAKGTRRYARSTYPNTWNDIYAAFIERGVDLLISRSRLGAITSATFLNLATLETFREFLLSSIQSEHFIHLGTGVMDDAAVSAACSILLKQEPANRPVSILFQDVRDSEDRGNAILISTEEIARGCVSSPVNIMHREALRSLPNRIFAYWLSEKHRQVLTKLPRLEQYAHCSFGLHSHGSDDQLYRAWWEPRVDKHFASNWPCVKLGGDPEHFYRDSYYVVNWINDGAAIREVARTAKGGTLVGSDYYFKPGLTYIYTAQTTFSVQPLEEGSVLLPPLMGVSQTGN